MNIKMPFLKLKMKVKCLNCGAQMKFHEDARQGTLHCGKCKAENKFEMVNDK